MLLTQGDLIPVEPQATSIPWTKRKSQILNFLHRGKVDFSTLVYDTNVGDISAISTYFNPERVSVQDLNTKFGQHPSINPEKDEKKDGVNSRKPILLLYPEHNQNYSKARRTLSWVMSHNEYTSPPQQLSISPPENGPQQLSTTLPDNWQQTPDNYQQLAQSSFNLHSTLCQLPSVKCEPIGEQQSRSSGSVGRPLQYSTDFSFSTDSLLSTDLKFDNAINLKPLSLLLEENRQGFKYPEPLTPIGYPLFEKITEMSQSTSPGSCNMSNTTSPDTFQTEHRDYRMWDN